MGNRKKEPLYLQLYRSGKEYLNESKKQFRFRRFYMASKDDTRGSAAQIIDFVVGKMILFFVLFFAAFLYYQQLYTALLFTVILFIVFHFIGSTLRNWKLEGIKIQKRHQLANKKIYQDLMNQTEDELKEYLERFYASLGCKEVKHVFSSTRLAIYQGSLEGKPVRLMFYVHKGDYEVEVKDLKIVLKEMKRLDVHQGMLFTTSEFAQESCRFQETIEAPFQLKLFNREQVLMLIQKYGLGPTSEEIDSLLENQLRKKEIQWEKYRKAMRGKYKVRNYLVLSIFLFITGFYTPYSLYYYAMSGISMSMAVLTLSIKVWDHFKEEKEPELVVNQIFKEI